MTLHRTPTQSPAGGELFSSGVALGSPLQFRQSPRELFASRFPLEAELEDVERFMRGPASNMASATLRRTSSLAPSGIAARVQEPLAGLRRVHSRQRLGQGLFGPPAPASPS